MEDKVTIKSMVNAQVSVNLREINRRFFWPRKGAVVKVKKEDFEVMSYDPGFERMVKTGILFIQEMDVKKELGLEPEDATAPVNYIELTDSFIQRILTVMPIVEFKGQLSKLSEAQRREVATYMVNHSGNLSVDRFNAMKEITGIDVMNAIKLKQQNEEPDPKKEG